MGLAAATIILGNVGFFAGFIISYFAAGAGVLFSLVVGIGIGAAVAATVTATTVMSAARQKDSVRDKQTQTKKEGVARDR